MSNRRLIAAALALSLGGAAQAHAQTAAAPPADAAPPSLKLTFATGSAAVRPQDMAILDQAARLYRDGNPIVMVVSGSADAVGNPAANLKLSQQRALAVLNGLVARGIPVERFQVTAKGSTDLKVPTAAGVAEANNRVAEISWR